MCSVYLSIGCLGYGISRENIYTIIIVGYTVYICEIGTIQIYKINKKSYSTLAAVLKKL